MIWYHIFNLQSQVVVSFICRVDWWVIEHLSIEGQAACKGKAQLILMFQQNLIMSFWCIWHINNCWKQIRNKKVMALQNKGDEKTKKNKPPNTIEASSQTSKNSLYVIIKLLRWFVELQVLSCNILNRLK